MCKANAVLASIQRRTESSLARGGDGYVETAMLSFDVGLCNRKVRQILLEATQNGLVEKKSRGPGRACHFRFVRRL